MTSAPGRAALGGGRGLWAVVAAAGGEAPAWRWFVTATVPVFAIGVIVLARLLD